MSTLRVYRRAAECLAASRAVLECGLLLAPFLEGTPVASACLRQVATLEKAARVEALLARLGPLQAKAKRRARALRAALLRRHETGRAYLEALRFSIEGPEVRS